MIGTAGVHLIVTPTQFSGGSGQFLISGNDVSDRRRFGEIWTYFSRHRGLKWKDGSPL